MSRQAAAAPTGEAAQPAPVVIPDRRRRGWDVSSFSPVLSTAAVLLLWEILVAVLHVPGHILPLPSDIAVKIVQDFPRLAPNIAITAAESLAGLFLSVVVAVPHAVAIVYLPAVERAIYPLIVATQAIPKIAIAPLFIVWFGFGIQSKLLVAFLVTFFPILIDTVVGLKSVSPEYLNLVRSMRASELQILTQVRLPFALPHFLAGLKVAVTLAVIGALVGEFMGADVGLGYQLLVANGFVDTLLLFAILVLLSLMGIVFFYAVVILERFTIPWHVSQRVSVGRSKRRSSRAGAGTEGDAWATLSAGTD